MLNSILQGNSLDVLKTLPDNSVHAIVTDPPYELGFMNKKWDSTGIAYNIDIWKQCFRVLIPGGHLLAFGGTRTYHRMTITIEDAGFEIRDMLEWIYASGFPKSQNIGKAYDKKMNNKRNEFEESHWGRKYRKAHHGFPSQEHNRSISGLKKIKVPKRIVSKGTSPYEGLGSGLKPAHEPICLARKPLSEKTIVDNVIKWNTGALSIDDCRIPTNQKTGRKQGNFCFGDTSNKSGYISNDSPQGRFPANLICQDDALNDGVSTKSLHRIGNRSGKRVLTFGKFDGQSNVSMGHSDSGSKSRFFDLDIWAEKYGLLQFPKASKSEKNKGLEQLNLKRISTLQGSDNDKDNLDPDSKRFRTTPAQNNHPTVKPIKLISYLIALISREGQLVLDPFAGSGTTLVAAKILNRNYIGIELNPEYIQIAQARIASILSNTAKKTTSK